MIKYCNYKVLIQYHLGYIHLTKKINRYGCFKDVVIEIRMMATNGKNEIMMKTI